MVGPCSCANLDQALAIFSVSKTWLVVKDRCYLETEVVFAGINVKVTNER